MSIKVYFVKDHDGEITAIFPEFIDPMRDRGKITCYAHIGQHSECCQQWIDGQVVVDESEYCELKSELESIGYVLEVVEPKQIELFA